MGTYEVAKLVNISPMTGSGLSENVGLIFPMIASHFSKRDKDHENHWL